MAKTLQFKRFTTSVLANTTGANGELIVDSNTSTITVHDGSKLGGWYTANAITLQSVFNRVNAAYAQANTDYITSNVAIILGIDVTQNSTINLAFTQANAAFTQANAAFNQANSVYLPSVTRLDVTNDGSMAYLFDQYAGNNATLYVTAGETISFNLNVTGHPFLIRVSSSNTLYNIGLTHVTTTGVVTTNADAQGKVSGTLYWKVPSILAGNTYVYQCQNHAGMVGNIVFASPNQSSLAFAAANSAATTIPQNRQSSNYVLNLTDAGKHLYYETSSNSIVYIPDTSNVAFSNGQTVMIVSRTSSSANIIVSPNASVSLYAAGNTTSGNHNVTSYGVATLMQVSANTWFIAGTGVV